MKISDLKQEQIKPGLQIRSLKDSNKLGYVFWTDEEDDYYSWVYWPSTDHHSGFYGTHCQCEVVEESLNKELTLEEVKKMKISLLGIKDDQ